MRLSIGAVGGYRVSFYVRGYLVRAWNFELRSEGV
jgi:hypothetical protein